MTDSQAIAANASKIETALGEWAANEENNREAWLYIFGTLLRDMVEHNAEAPSGDPEDSDVPECPSL